MSVFCPSPWHSVLINWNGDVYPDRQFNNSTGNIFNQKLSDIMNSDVLVMAREQILKGEFPDQCYRCKSKEKTIGSSRRTFYADVMKPMLEDGITYTAVSKPDIRFLEINPSNVCNLKCRMCSGVNSTAWIKDEKHLVDMGFPRSMNGVKYKTAPDGMAERIFENPEIFRNLVYITLKGGEPFVDEETFRIIDFLITEGISKNVTLDVSTNGTVVDQRIFDMAQHFKEIKFHVSMEATGEMYQYMRGGKNFSLDDLEKNILEFNKMKNTRVIFATVMCAYNLFEVPKIWEWFQKVRTDHSEVYFTNAVIEPNYLSINILPKHLLVDAAQMIVDAGVPNHLYGTSGPIIGTDKLVRTISDINPPENANELLGLFKRFTEVLDNRRGENLVSIEPKFADIMNK